MNLNLATLFESLADAIPDRLAVVSGTRRLTYAALEQRANRLAHALWARGIRAGDHLGLHLYNGSEFHEAMLAAFKIRAVPININYRYVDDELLYLFTNADLAGLVHQREFGPRIAALAPRAPSLRMRMVVDDDSGETVAAPGTQPYEAALAEGSPERDFAPRSGEDLYIIYTGGTTGLPRGVMWRHEDVFYAGLQGGNPGGPPVERAEQVADNAKARTSPMIVLPAAPFIHGAAQWAALIGFFSGG